MSNKVSIQVLTLYICRRCAELAPNGSFIYNVSILSHRYHHTLLRNLLNTHNNIRYLLTSRRKNLVWQFRRMPVLLKQSEQLICGLLNYNCCARKSTKFNVKQTFLPYLRFTLVTRRSTTSYLVHKWYIIILPRSLF